MPCRTPDRGHLVAGEFQHFRHSDPQALTDCLQGLEREIDLAALNLTVWVMEVSVMDAVRARSKARQAVRSAADRRSLPICGEYEVGPRSWCTKSFFQCQPEQRPTHFWRPCVTSQRMNAHPSIGMPLSFTLHTDEPPAPACCHEGHQRGGATA